MIKQIGLPLRGRPILLITRMITDRIGLYSVLLPLQIGKKWQILSEVWKQITPDNSVYLKDCVKRNHTQK